MKPEFGNQLKSISADKLIAALVKDNWEKKPARFQADYC
jgi:hypothetical protein